MESVIGSPQRWAPLVTGLPTNLHLCDIRRWCHAETLNCVCCTAGAAYDVAVDIRPDSPTFGRWSAIELSAAVANTSFIPEGVAHGFQTLSDETELSTTYGGVPPKSSIPE